MKILLIEDDQETIDYLAKGLAEHGHVIDRARDGRNGLFLAGGETYDLMIVDRMLPGLDGLAIVKTIRGAGVRTPILFLSTLGSRGAWIRGGRSNPNPVLWSGDADVARASKLEHVVEGMGGDCHLGRSTLVRTRAQRVASFGTVGLVV